MTVSDGNDRKVLEDFRAGLRAAPPRARGSASAPRASPAVDLRPVPDPEDLMRAACSAFTADRIDVYEYLERVDAIGLPRFAFVERPSATRGRRGGLGLFTATAERRAA